MQIKKIKQTSFKSNRIIFIVIFLFAVLLFFGYGIIAESRLSYLQTHIFDAANLPFKNFFIFNHKLPFPPYFIYYLLILSVICTVFFYFYSKLTGKNVFASALKTKIRLSEQKKQSFIINKKLFFIFLSIIVIHTVFINLFLHEKLFIIQISLFLAEIITIIFIALSVDVKNRINPFISGFSLFPEIKILLLFSIIIFILYTFDLESWKYSYIEDEWPFFDFIKGNLSGSNKINFFSGAGVYGYHPVLSSFWQLIIMFFTDNGIFGWKLSSAIIVPLCIIPFYLWNKMIFNRTVAILATIVFCFSNAMLGFSHIGYNNIQSVFFYVFVLFCLELAMRKKSYFWFLISGLIAGAGFYTFYTARIIILITFIYLILHPLKKQITKNQIIFFIFVFLLVISPIILEKNFISKILMQSVFAGSEIKNTDEKIIYIFLNFIHSFFAFLYKNKNTHYIIDGLIDIFSAIGVISGFIWIICSFIKDWRAKFLSITYLILIFFIGALQQYDYPVNTRLFFLVPVLATIAGIGLSILLTLSFYFKKNIKIHTLVLFIFCAIIIVNNLYTFYIKMPGKFHFSQQAYIMKILQKHKDKQIILVIYNIINFRRIIEFYKPKNKIIYSDMSNFERLLKENSVKNSIVVFDNLAEDKIIKIENDIKPEYLMDNLSQRTLFYIFDFTKKNDYYNRFYELWMVGI